VAAGGTIAALTIAALLRTCCLALWRSAPNLSATYPLPPGTSRTRFILLLAALSTIGPFSIDTFLPALPSLQADLQATPWQAQQVLSAYLAGFALMSLWHGAISDATGRRPVILVCLAVYAAAALACTFAPTIEILIAARLMQGLSGGVGMVMSRAIIRDCFDGPLAQKTMSNVMVIFAIAPAIAPVFGGHLHEWLGWRSIFAFMLAASILLWLWIWRALPETLPPPARQSLRPGTLLRSYAEVFKTRDFQLLAAALAFNFSTFFVYITASPAFILDHLHLTATDFGWFFIPAIGGMMIGNRIVNAMAGRVAPKRTVFIGFAVMGSGVGLNLLLQSVVAPELVPGSWLTFISIMPIVFTSLGQPMVATTLQLMVMDLFPEKRGMMSSCMGFTHVMVSAITAGLVAPHVADTALHLALASAAFFSVGLSFWLGYCFSRRAR
jgi:MFS transporter, DHA1 family, multidrug resistance protein